MSGGENGRQRKFPVLVKRGSSQVKIYRTLSHGCESYVLSFYQDGKRQRPSFSSFEKAKNEAEVVACRLGSADSAILKLTGADLSAYQRARQHLDPIGVAIEIAAAEFADAKKKLRDVPLARAVEFYLKRNVTDAKPQLVSKVVEELIDLTPIGGHFISRVLPLV